MVLFFLLRWATNTLYLTLGINEYYEVFLEKSINQTKIPILIDREELIELIMNLKM